MRTPELMIAMAKNNRWSNDRLYRAMVSLAPGEFEAPRTGFFPSIGQTANHIHAVDLYYLDALEGSGLGPAAFTDHVATDDAAALAAAQANTDSRLIRFCEKTDADGLARVIATDRGGAGPVRERVGDLLVHLFLHQVHHRGQLHAMLSGSSVPPPQLDEFFLEFDRAARREEIDRLGL